MAFSRGRGEKLYKLIRRFVNLNSNFKHTEQLERNSSHNRRFTLFFVCLCRLVCWWWSCGFDIWLDPVLRLEAGGANLTIFTKWKIDMHCWLASHFVQIEPLGQCKRMRPYSYASVLCIMLHLFAREIICPVFDWKSVSQKYPGQLRLQMVSLVQLEFDFLGDVSIWGFELS